MAWDRKNLTFSQNSCTGAIRSVNRCHAVWETRDRKRKGKILCFSQLLSGNHSSGTWVSPLWLELPCSFHTVEGSKRQLPVSTENYSGEKWGVVTVTVKIYQQWQRGGKVSISQMESERKDSFQRVGKNRQYMSWRPLGSSWFRDMWEWVRNKRQQDVDVLCWTLQDETDLIKGDKGRRKIWRFLTWWDLILVECWKEGSARRKRGYEG